MPELAQKLAQMCQESKIIMYAQSVLKDNPKIYIAVLIAQAVHAGSAAQKKTPVGTLILCGFGRRFTDH